jgi:molybdopterin-binding protein
MFPLGLDATRRIHATRHRSRGRSAKAEIQCGPYTVVSLMSTEAARELKLEPGSVAVAVVKATTVIVETPEEFS